MVEDDPSTTDDGGVFDEAEQQSLADESEAVFSVLGDETRLEILLELADRADTERADRACSFSDLRRAVGVEDAGRFNYHLDKLQDTFVRKDEEGYRATVAGLQVASSIHAGRYAGDAAVETADTEYDCPACGEPLRVAYEDEVVQLGCANDHLSMSYPVPAGAATDRSATELLDVAVRRSGVNFELARTDLCPRCWGHVSIDLHPPDGTFEAGGEDYPRVDVECERCWLAYSLPGPMLIARSPPVVAFYADHGLDPEQATLGERNVLNAGEWTITSESPTRFELAIDLEGDRLVVEVGPGGEILEHSRD